MNVEDILYWLQGYFLNHSTDDILMADKFLLQFGRRFEVIYGKEAITPNMHMHGHLAECIFDYGPIYVIFLAFLI